MGNTRLWYVQFREILEVTDVTQNTNAEYKHKFQRLRNRTAQILPVDFCSYMGSMFCGSISGTFNLYTLFQAF